MRQLSDAGKILRKSAARSSTTSSDCLFIAVLQEADASLTQFAGKALNRKPGPQQQAGIQDGIEAGQLTPGQESARGEVSRVRRSAP